ncbi:MAG: hypothetical protein AB7P02_12160, partial [Alphaproteobacteria bacterium]
MPESAEPPVRRAGPTIRLEACLAADDDGGRAARAWKATLAETGFPHLAVECGDDTGERGETIVLRQIGAGLPASVRPHCRLSVGLWDPRIDEPVPEEWRRAAPADEIWVPSRQVAAAAAPALAVPVVAILPAALPPTAPPDRAGLRLPQEALLFAAAGAGAQAALQAFVAAFPAPGGGAALALAATGAPRLAALSAARPDIRVLADEADDAIGRLIAACEVFVALDDAATFGWLPAAAVAAGRPVIATADFAARDYLLGAVMPIPRVRDAAPAGLGRSRPDLAQAAAAMRHLVGDRALVAAVAAAAARAGRRLTPAAAARRVLRRLAALDLGGRRRTGRMGWTRSVDGHPAAAIFGHLSDAIGYGSAAQGTAAALAAAGVRATAIDIPYWSAVPAV